MRKVVLAALCLVQVLWAGTVLEVYDTDVNAGDSVTWNSGDTVVLKEMVFVDSGATLIIQPGVVVRGDAMQTGIPSGIVICRNAKIFAEGTKDQPIIMTDMTDSLLPPTGQESDYNRGKWGGLMILGNARANVVKDGADIGTGDIRHPWYPVEEKWAFGGSDDDDNSGVLRYVSIRAAGDMYGEIQWHFPGLTLAAVGRGTTIENVDIYNCHGTGLYLCGGTVNCRYLSVALSSGRPVESIRGWRGLGMYWLLLGSRFEGTELIRLDGHDERDEAGTVQDYPKIVPVLGNITAIGNSDLMGPIGFYNLSAGKVFNSLFYGMEQIQIAPDCQQFIGDEDIGFYNSVFENGKIKRTLVSWATYAADFGLQGQLRRNGNSYEDPLLLEVELPSGYQNPKAGGHALDFRPTHDNLITNTLSCRPDIREMEILNESGQGSDSGFFTMDENYNLEADTASPMIGIFKGAFNPVHPTASRWIEGWTGLSQYGYLTTKDTAYGLDSATTAYLPEKIALCPTKIAQSMSPVKNDIDFHISLTPSRSEVMLGFSLALARDVEISVFDILGRNLLKVSKDLSPARHRLTLPLKSSADGCYIVRVKSADGVTHRRFQILH